MDRIAGGFDVEDQPPPGGSRTGQAPAAAPSWQALFQARFERLESLHAAALERYPAEHWRLKLLGRALFSTWSDLRELGAGQGPESLDGGTG